MPPATDSKTQKRPEPATGADGLAEVKEPGPGHEVQANYQYWRDHGGEWGPEYDQRKLVVPLYHIQELMLTEYMAHHAPARVLEFGCGPGRHLRNLSQVPGLEVRGFDQSAAMVSGCLRWTGQDWIDRHITIGMPTGRLPFKDGEFDIVYSAEVLVHVRPEDLPGILSEMIRISKRQVFHLEPDEHIDIIPDDHFGCWKHDLVAAYAALGRECRILTSGYKAHAPYRVILDSSAPTWEWSPLTIALYRRMETDLSQGFANLRGAVERARAESVSPEKAREAEQFRAALAAQRALTREQVTGLLAEIEVERARSAQATTAQWHTLRRLRELFPGR